MISSILSSQTSVSQRISTDVHVIVGLLIRDLRSHQYEFFRCLISIGFNPLQHAATGEDEKGMAFRDLSVTGSE